MQSFCGARSALRTKTSAIEAGRVSVACPRRSSRLSPVGLIGFLSRPRSAAFLARYGRPRQGYIRCRRTRNDRARGTTASSTVWREEKGPGTSPAPQTPKWPLAAEERGVRDGPEDAADDRGHDRDPGVPPVRASLAGYRQDGVGDARPEVAGRVDRVARGSAQREPDAEHEQTHQKRVEAAADHAGGGIATHRAGVCDYAENTEDEHEGADDLGNEVRRGVVDRRRGAVHAELEAGVGRLPPVQQVGQPHEHRPHEGPEELRDDVAWDHRPIELSGYGETDGHGRVDMGAAELADAVNGHRDCHPPPEGDDDPARVLRLGVP